MWRVSSRSGVATLRTAIHLLLTHRCRSTDRLIYRPKTGYESSARRRSARRPTWNHLPTTPWSRPLRESSSRGRSATPGHIAFSSRRAVTPSAYLARSRAAASTLLPAKYIKLEIKSDFFHAIDFRQADRSLAF